MQSMRNVKWPSGRMVAKVAVPVAAMLAAMVIYVQASKLDEYSKLSGYTPSENAGQLTPGLNVEDSAYHEFLAPTVPVDNVAGLKLSPLELIPKFNSDMANNRKKSWDVLGRKHRYKFFDELSQEARCFFYFHKLYTMTPGWRNDYQKWNFIINDEEESHLVDVDEGAREAVRTRKREVDMALGMERLRMYDQCFVSEVAERIDMAKIFDSVPDEAADQWDFEHRMFPIVRRFNQSTFENIMPQIINPKGRIMEQGYLPKIEHGKYTTADAVKYEYDAAHSFLWNWNHMSGMVAPRGIVLSFGDGQLYLAAKLLAHWRFTGNKLPIQVVTKGDISRDTIDTLLKIAQSDELVFPDIDYKDGQNVKQDLWFLDVSPTLDPGVMDSFERFKNKWLATSFNLFEEYVFIDVDAVNYVDMNYFFDNTDYVKTGTLFFKDRFLNEGIPDPKCPAKVETLAPRFLESRYFHHFPSINADYVEFQCENLLTPEEKGFRDFFFDNKKHQMDSGLVVVDKSSHSVPLMISLLMHLTPELAGCSHGDKEFFWLGFYVSGHHFSFHASRPGATGHYQDQSNVDRQLKQRKSEVCSITISHLHPRDGLLWVNGGTQYCKFDVAKNDWEDEGLRMSSKFATFEEVQKVYQGAVDMQAGIIPADKGDAWGKPDGRCRGYYYCARYERHLKPYSFNKVYEKGRFLMFSSEQRARYNAINQVWVADYLQQAFTRKP
ncbi:LADA_0A05248g1_1 [Lachancea dasiensis]|uniref:LADA_0A05248g1_1 n=1 Tax=Lachancea dasiensis TaxID=1072105 RepID=A0A1G4IP01_9SACH|nr:LADA_0A05248g1_1 [Lachancea dasiensis]